MSDPQSEYRALMWNPVAVEAVRARQKREGRILRIPLYCEGHRTGAALAIEVTNEAPYSGPEEKVDVRIVPYHLQMYPVFDVKDVNHENAESEEGGFSYTIRCGTCSRASRRQRNKLLRAAIECVIKAGTDAGSGWRISLT